MKGALYLAVVSSGLLWGCQIMSGLDGLQVGEAALRDAGTRSDAVRCGDGSAAVCPGPDPCACAPDAAVRCEGDEPDPACSCQPSIVGAPCDLVAQCGCATGESCQIRDGAPGCFASGSAALGASCVSDEECGGAACVAGLCERFCASNADCDDGMCRELPASVGVKACLRRCDFESQAPCEAPAACVRFVAGAPGAPPVLGDYCAVPANECVTDQRCEEPAWGTRRCVAGSDAADCACTSAIAGASCDLITQCGCAPGTHCALAGVGSAPLSVTCIADRVPVREPGAACNDESECPSGHSCWRGICERYCDSDAACGAGRCLAISGPAEISGVRVCTIGCTFETEVECGSGTRCVHAPDGSDYCLVPRTPCPFEGDNVCDEPAGSRICGAGTDQADCS